MKTNIFAVTLSILLFAIAAFAQQPDKAKLDQFFDKLAEKNKAMGSIAIVRDGKPVYSRFIGFGQVG